MTIESIIKKEILVVDDDKGIKMITERILTSAGYNVRTAEDGQEGLEEVKKKKPDGILSDHDMPRLRGPEFLAKAKEMYPQLPCIIMCGRLPDITRQEGIGYITKPFTKEELLTKIKHHIGNGYKGPQGRDKP